MVYLYKMDIQEPSISGYSEAFHRFILLHYNDLTEKIYDAAIRWYIRETPDKTKYETPELYLAALKNNRIVLFNTMREIFMDKFSEGGRLCQDEPGQLGVHMEMMSYGRSCPIILRSNNTGT